MFDIPLPIYFFTKEHASKTTNKKIETHITDVIISSSIRPMDPKLSPPSHVIFRRRGTVTNKKRYNSFLTRPMDPKHSWEVS